MLGKEPRAVFNNIVEDIGHNISGADCIDAYTVVNDLQGQRASQLGQRTF